MAAQLDLLVARRACPCRTEVGSGTHCRMVGRTSDSTTQIVAICRLAARRSGGKAVERAGGLAGWRLDKQIVGICGLAVGHMADGWRSSTWQTAGGQWRHARPRPGIVAQSLGLMSAGIRDELGLPDQGIAMIVDGYAAADPGTMVMTEATVDPAA